MSARIVVIVNQKGGSGKTTITMQLAATWAKQRLKCLVVDADPQNTAVNWAASADENHPFPASVSNLSQAKGKLHQMLKPYVEDYDIILVDCPPSLESRVPLSALLVADLAVVPVLPSPPDIWASIGIAEVIENARTTVNEDLVVRIVLNQASPQRTLSGDAVEVLKEFRYPLAKTVIRQREAYRQSAAIGGSVHDMGSKAKSAIEDIKALAKELKKAFNG